MDSTWWIPLSVLVFWGVGRRFPLRPTSGGWNRVLRNLTLGGTTYIVQKAVAVPLILWAAEWVTLQGWPFYERVLEVSLWIRFPLGLLAADLILYTWHRLNHRVPFLWRFHRVHHSDSSMDATTAVRFHPGEYLLSSGTSVLQAIVVGPQQEVWLAYEFLISVLVVFHHSEWKLPMRVERWLHRVIVTPRSHTLHHSVVPREQDSNFGTIFSFWDRIFRTCTPIEPDRASQVVLGVERPPQEKWHFLVLAPFYRNHP